MLAGYPSNGLLNGVSNAGLTGWWRKIGLAGNACVGLGAGWCDFGVVVVAVLKGGVKGGGSSVGAGARSWD